MGIALLLALAFSGGTRLPAAESEDGLKVSTLRDGGGIERGLNLRLTEALAKFLRENRSAHPPLGQEVASPLYALEGEVSFAAGGSDDAGRYLMLARLFRGRPGNKKERTLIGQWAGTAVSLRYLTANLRHDPRTHTYGLIGELGSRALAAMDADRQAPASRWHTLFAQLRPVAPPPLFQADSETAMQSPGKAKARAIREISTGRSFQVALPTQEAAQDFLFLFDGAGRPTLIPLAPQQRSGALKNGLYSQPVQAPAGTAEVWKLQSRPAPVSGPIAASCADEPLPATRSDDPPVSVLEGVGPFPNVPAMDTAQKSLYAKIRARRQLWRIARLQIKK